MRGLSLVRIGAVGPRPNAFNATRFSEKLFEANGIAATAVMLDNRAPHARMWMR